MRTTVDIQPQLLHYARAEAARLGLTVSQVIEIALTRQLVERPSSTAKPFTLRTAYGRLLHPGLDLDHTSALLADEDIDTYR